MSDYQTLISHFEALNLNNMHEYYSALLDKIQIEDMSLTSTFRTITDKKMMFQKDKKMERGFTAHDFLT